MKTQCTRISPDTRRRAGRGRAGVLIMLSLLTIGTALCAQDAAPLDLIRARLDLERLQALIPSWRPVTVAADSEVVVIEPGDTLTVEALRGVAVDPNPPKLADQPVRYDPRQRDDCPPDARPYVAEGILPFRLREFNCEFNYGGWHNFDMQDYAAAHGFGIIYPYTRKVKEIAHWPEGTQVLNWGGFVNWHAWFEKHDLPDGRYDLLASMDLVAKHLEEDRFERDLDSDNAKAHADLLMIDQEHSVLPPERLREQPWYPGEATEKERAEFEKRYYDGYGQTYISSVQAARKQGWKNISIYGWYPYGRTWGGLEQADPDPRTDLAWNAFGKAILKQVDIVNNSVYCFYWTPKNVAYTLANVHLNLRMVRSEDPDKPVRPYYWTLLHGGGGGWRWWRGQPLPNEEQRAMTAMAFFTGIDGFDSWNWSGTGSHHSVSLRSATRKGPDRIPVWTYHDVMVATPFSLPTPEGDEESFARYDVLHITAVDEEVASASFQKIRPGQASHGADPQFPVFTMPRDELIPLLRPKSEPVAAMIEGMALVKPFEFLLRHGKVHVDVSAQEQFEKTLPVVRRVQFGPYHVIATYDPAVVHGGSPRSIELKDVPGLEGKTIRLPADAQTRITVLTTKTEDMP